MHNNNLFGYYQKSAFFSRIARYIVTLLFIVFLFSCIIIFGKDITAENVQLLAKYISLNDGSASLYTDEFSITADDSSDFIMLSDNLAVIRKNNISLYDLSGQKLFSYNYSYSSPASVSDLRNILVYDITGNELTVFNSFSKIKSIPFSHGVTSADINPKGIAAVSNDESYRSTLTVYNTDYEQIYKWYSSDSYISGAVLSADGKYVLTLSAEADNGSYSCNVSVFDIHSSSSLPIHTAALIDELPIKAGYSQDRNSIFVITDSNIHFFTSDLEPVSTYKFNQSKVEDYYIGENYIILTEKTNLSGNSMSITGISKNGNIIFSFDVIDEICDISIANNKFFALGEKAVYEFSADNDTFSQTGISKINEKYISVLSDSSNNCYIISHSKVRKTIFNDPKDAD